MDCNHCPKCGLKVVSCYKYVKDAARRDPAGEERHVPPAAPADGRYNTVDECPDWARKTVQKLIDKKYLDGNGQSLDLSHDMVRLLVIQDRAGCYRE